MITIRRWNEDDDVSALTALLHRAYAPLAAAGMKFVASYQDDEQTLKRIKSGVCFVAEAQRAVVGTVTYRRGRPGDGAGCAWYARPEVGIFGQFAVEPALQGRGIGAAMLAHVEQFAIDDGATELALDTSERAAKLIEYYLKRGYREVGFTQWSVTNYRSVILSKALL